MSDERKIKKCTKDHPFVPPPKDNEFWLHEDAYNKFPESDFIIATFHCPNCGIDFDVDMG